LKQYSHCGPDLAASACCVVNPIATPKPITIIAAVMTRMAIPPLFGNFEFIVAFFIDVIIYPFWKLLLIIILRKTKWQYCLFYYITC
jgi:hypothetical protein